MPTGKYTSADIATPETQAQTSAPEQEGNSLQRSFDENTKPEAGEPKLKSFLKGAVSGVGSPFVHPIDTVRGMAKDLALPVTGTNMDEVENSLPKEGEAGTSLANTAGQVLGGSLLGGAASGIGGAVIDKIPTRAKAGDIFNRLNQQLKDQPVNLANAEPHLQKMLQLGKEGGGAVPAPVRQLANTGGAGTPKSVPLLRRMENELNGVETTPSPQPLTYPAARNFQSGMARLSREDLGNMSGPMTGNLKQLNRAFYNDIKGAADAGGLGEDYANAMKMNRQAEQLRNAFKTAGKAAATGAVGYGGVKLAKDLIGR